MADRFDNSRTRRPATDGGMRNDGQLPEDDPLAELARIVAGNESFDQILGSRGRPAAEPPAAPQAPRDVSFDLEAELLNDLHSSFDPAARQADPRAAAPAPRGMPPSREGEPPRAAPTRLDAPPPRAAEPFGKVPDFVRASQAQQQRRPPVAPPVNFDDEADQDFEDDYVDDGEAAGYDYGDGSYAAEQDLEPPPRRRFSKLLIAAAVVGVMVVAGVVSVFVLRDRPGMIGGVPQVITADQAPTKIVPPASESQSAQQDAQQNKLIYDRADPDKGSPDTLEMPPTSSSAADVAQSNESEASREISRIILPGDGDQSADQAPSGDGSDANPRKVRTVVVKPDGTIVSSEAAPRGGAAPADGAGAQQALAQANPAPAQDNSPPADTAPAVVADDSVPPQPAPVAQPAPVQPAPAAPAPTPAPAVRHAAAAPPPQASDAAPAAAASGGFVVQITSQRSEAAATAAYKALQKKFPSVFGGMAPDIAKADLGAKGVYYRVRVGPMSTRDKAVSFCEKLRAAGGDCIVQKN